MPSVLLHGFAVAAYLFIGYAAAFDRAENSEHDSNRESLLFVLCVVAWPLVLAIALIREVAGLLRK